MASARPRAFGDIHPTGLTGRPRNPSPLGQPPFSAVAEHPEERRGALLVEHPEERCNDTDSDDGSMPALEDDTDSDGEYTPPDNCASVVAEWQKAMKVVIRPPSSPQFAPMYVVPTSAGGHIKLCNVGCSSFAEMNTDRIRTVQLARADVCEKFYAILLAGDGDPNLRIPAARGEVGLVCVGSNCHLRTFSHASVNDLIAHAKRTLSNSD